MATLPILQGRAVLSPSLRIGWSLLPTSLSTTDLRPSFQPRPQPAFRRRKLLLQRLCLLAGVSLLLSILIFPSWRAAILPTLSLGLAASTDDLHLQTVRNYDLSQVQGSDKGWENEERVLMCTPLRDAASHLPLFFSHLRNLDRKSVV